MAARPVLVARPAALLVHVLILMCLSVARTERDEEYLEVLKPLEGPANATAARTASSLALGAERDDFEHLAVFKPLEGPANAAIVQTVSSVALVQQHRAQDVKDVVDLVGAFLGGLSDQLGVAGGIVAIAVGSTHQLMTHVLFQYISFGGIAAAGYSAVTYAKELWDEASKDKSDYCVLKRAGAKLVLALSSAGLGFASLACAVPWVAAATGTLGGVVGQAVGLAEATSWCQKVQDVQAVEKKLDVEVHRDYNKDLSKLDPKEADDKFPESKMNLLDFLRWKNEQKVTCREDLFYQGHGFGSSWNS